VLARRKTAWTLGKEKQWSVLKPTLGLGLRLDMDCALALGRGRYPGETDGGMWEKGTGGRKNGVMLSFPQGRSYRHPSLTLCSHCSLRKISVPQIRLCRARLTDDDTKRGDAFLTHTSGDAALSQLSQRREAGALLPRPTVRRINLFPGRRRLRPSPARGGS